MNPCLQRHCIKTEIAATSEQEEPCIITKVSGDLGNIEEPSGWLGINEMFTK